MIASEKEKFFLLIADVLAFYAKDFSAFAGRVWWEAMKPFDFAAVADALNRHCINPDTGQFVPKPADVVRMLQGSTQDSAMKAWSKVDKAVRQVGGYRDVVFDDPLIHRVLHDMGGWLSLGTKTEDEWPFVAKEFENRYRGYRGRNEVPEYPQVLLGVAGAENRRGGFATEQPVLIGDAAKARQVMAGGKDEVRLGITQAGDAVKKIAHG